MELILLLIEDQGRTILDDLRQAVFEGGRTRGTLRTLKLGVLEKKPSFSDQYSVDNSDFSNLEITEWRLT
ncbi:hypothetical protein Bca4012_083422 [Brassica carinata]